MIAGMPVNRVHELEWSPGEVRYNIDMENTLDRLRGGPGKVYLDTIQQGKIQLANFQKHPELMVNIKEKRLMEEMEAEEDRVRKAKEAEKARRAEQEGKKAATSFREPRAVTRGDSEGDLSDFMPLGVLGLAGAMATFNGGKDEKDENDQKKDSIADRQVVAKDEGLSSELKVMEDLIDRHPIAIPEMSSDSFEALMKIEQQTEEEKLALAAAAMEEYMEKDDGGDAWLQSVASIMEENE